VSPATAPWRKGLSFEMMEKVTELVKSLEGAFNEQEVCNTLRNNHFDISRTREELLGIHSEKSFKESVAFACVKDKK
jgi:hypothetical protein